MVFFLILNVANDHVQLGMSIGKRAIPFLPGELSLDPLVFVYVSRRVSFDISDQIRKRHRRLKSNQNVKMVRHTANDDQLLPLILNDSGYVLVQILLEVGLDQRQAIANCEHGLNVDLREGVCHQDLTLRSYGAKKICSSVWL